MKKETLTPQEERLIPIIREKWLSRFFFDKKLNEDKLNDYIKFIYCDLCKLKMPQIIIVDSPYGAELCYNILKYLNIKNMKNIEVDIRDNILDKIRDKIRDNIRDKIRADIGDDVQDNIRDNIVDTIWDNIVDNIRDNIGVNWDTIGDDIRDTIWDTIWDNIVVNIWDNIRVNWDTIGDDIRNNIRDTIWDNIVVNIWDNIVDNIRANKIEFTHFGHYGDCSDFGWVAFYDYFDEIKIESVTDLFRKYRDLIYETNPFLFLYFNGMVIAIRHPTTLTRNREGRLHNTESPAIEFADGYFQHYVHGIYFTEKEFETYFKKKVTFSQIMKIDNAEKRCAVLMERKLDVIKSKSFKLIAEDIDPSNNKPRKLYEFTYNTRKKHVVVYHDTTHQDKVYATLVPIDCKTPHEAIVWMNYGIDTDTASISS